MGFNRVVGVSVGVATGGPSVVLEDEVGESFAVAGVGALNAAVGEMDVAEGEQGARGGGADGVEGEGKRCEGRGWWAGSREGGGRS